MLDTAGGVDELMDATFQEGLKISRHPAARNAKYETDVRLCRGIDPRIVRTDDFDSCIGYILSCCFLQEFKTVALRSTKSELDGVVRNNVAFERMTILDGEIEVESPDFETPSTDALLHKQSCLVWIVRAVF